MLVKLQILRRSVSSSMTELYSVHTLSLLATQWSHPRLKEPFLLYPEYKMWE